jgi:hypothetical protein
VLYVIPRTRSKVSVECSFRKGTFIQTIVLQTPGAFLGLLVADGRNKRNDGGKEPAADGV